MVTIAGPRGVLGCAGVLLQEAHVLIYHAVLPGIVG